MLFRPDRRRRAADRTLPHRMALFATGAGLALAGMLWQRSVLVIIAIVVLTIGVALGRLERRTHERDAADDPAGPRDGPA